MAPRKTKPVEPPNPPRRESEWFATWRTPPIGGHQAPFVWAGDVNVYRYRTTVERIEEPREVIEARIVDLYRASDNMHHREALRAEAKRLGFDLWAALKEE